MGGAEQYLFEMTQYLDSIHQQVTVLFLKKKQTGFWQDALKNTQVKLHYFEALTERKGILLLLKWILSNSLRFDYCLTSHIHLNGLVGGFRRMKLVQIGQHIGRESTIAFDRLSGVSLFIRVKIYYLFGYRALDLLITQSEKMKQSLLDHLSTRVLPPNIQTIPNLVNRKSILEKSMEFVPDFKHYLVAAGRLIPEKGFDTLIDAFAELQDQTLQLVILGEGHLRASLQAQINALGLNHRVWLVGFVPNPMPYFRQATACVVSSRIEGFPNVLLQMMCLNDRVISTLCAGGIDELKGVHTCPINSSQRLKESIALALKSPNTLAFAAQLEGRSVASYWGNIHTSLKSS